MREVDAGRSPREVDRRRAHPRDRRHRDRLLLVHRHGSRHLLLAGNGGIAPFGPTARFSRRKPCFGVFCRSGVRRIPQHAKDRGAIPAGDAEGAASAERALWEHEVEDFEQRVSELPRGWLYLVYCAGGSRSAQACEEMRRFGFERIYDLDGGFGAWDEAGCKWVCEEERDPERVRERG